MLEIKNIHSSVEDIKILKGVDLELREGEITVLMGPNGSGKSTLAQTLMGHPKYSVSEGIILLDGQNILEMSPDERARLGIFLAFQYPLEIEGVSFMNFLWTSYKTLYKKENPKVSEFRKKVDKYLDFLGLDKKFISRHLNVGFSGGEKKRAEILQMLVLNPQIIVLDETDSGLDIDSIKIVAKAINFMKERGKTILLITHYRRIVDYIRADKVHIMSSGKIMTSGGIELLERVELEGFKWLSGSLEEV